MGDIKIVEKTFLDFYAAGYFEGTKKLVWFGYTVDEDFFIAFQIHSKKYRG